MTTWIVVADSSRAQLFQRSNGGLKLVDEISHPESREQGRDLIGNRPHRLQSSGEKTLSDPHAIQDVESERFAKQVIEFLHRRASENAFEGLVVIAPKRFLGMLRPRYTPLLKPRVRDEIAKDLGHAGVEDIERAVQHA
jgi:protein required for attachment to host cells